VTFVENVLATAHFVKGGGAGRLGDRARGEAASEAFCARSTTGAASSTDTGAACHYFSDWIWSNAARGWLADVKEELGGVPDPEPIDFMTAHPGAYRQLADPAVLEPVGVVEWAISLRGRSYVPKERIAEAALGIRDGDVIAATSTVPGLDIAHTGLAAADGAPSTAGPDRGAIRRAGGHRRVPA
jgi:hypothetical protein